MKLDNDVGVDRLWAVVNQNGNMTFQIRSAWSSVFGLKGSPDAEGDKGDLAGSADVFATKTLAQFRAKNLRKCYPSEKFGVIEVEVHTK